MALWATRRNDLFRLCVNLADLGGLSGALVFMLRLGVEALRGLMSAVLILAAVVTTQGTSLLTGLDFRIFA
jgi:hypothetical protein